MRYNSVTDKQVLFHFMIRLNLLPKSHLQLWRQTFSLLSFFLSYCFPIDGITLMMNLRTCAAPAKSWPCLSKIQGPYIKHSSQPKPVNKPLEIMKYYLWSGQIPASEEVQVPARWHKILMAGKHFTWRLNPSAKGRLTTAKQRILDPFFFFKYDH